MKYFQDRFGRKVRLTDESLAHILEHPEMLEAENRRDSLVSTMCCKRWRRQRRMVVLQAEQRFASKKLFIDCR